MSLRLFSFIVFSCCIIACKNDPDNKSEKRGKTDDTVKQTVPATPPLRVTYRLLPLNDSLIKTLDQNFDSTQLSILLALNRIDRHKLRAKDTLVIPDTFVTDFNTYAPFPIRMPLLDSVQKILLCSYPLEAFAAYERGKLVRWGPSSMGKKSTPTPLGLFHTNWKAKQTKSTIDSSWILNWYFNLTNFGGVSLHEYELPGYAASHSCVRLKVYDAEWIYYWAQQWKMSPDESKILAYGTPVIIFGTYNFKQRKPWNKLAGSADNFNISTDSLNAVVQSYLPRILERQATRDSVIAGLTATSIMLTDMK